ncbi:glycosyltransferase family 39 protein [bacterium]|nr:glycosyltransferase family 39 protein [bacterium]
MSCPAPANPPAGQPSWRQHLTGGPALVAYLAVLKLLIHLLTARNYGPFVDELYFMACGEHLAWGYVDLPPLTAVQAWLARQLFGYSVFGMHLLPALQGAGLVLLTGALARALGGSRFAQALAALAVIVPAAYLQSHSYLSMNAVEPLIWMGCAWMVIRLVQTGNPRWWLGLGVLAGLGLLNKHTMLLFGAALVSGLMLTPARRLMANRWFLVGGLLAFLIVLPNLLWMIAHQFPHLEFAANIRRAGRNVLPGPGAFLWGQVQMMHPTTLLLWLGGLGYFLFHRDGRSYRFLGWTFLVLLVLLLSVQGRTYYLAPAYPMLMAGGAVVFDQWIDPRTWSAWIKALAFATMAFWGTLGAPFSLPVLPPEQYIRYADLAGIEPQRLETRPLNKLPELFAARFGWREMVQTVARVYHALPPDERARTAILAGDFGEAGAIDFYGPRLGLPKAISGYLTYFYWGPREYTGESVIVFGQRRPETLPQFFGQVEQVALVQHPYAAPHQQFPVFLCRQPKRPLAEMWPAFKDWN